MLNLALRSFNVALAIGTLAIAAHAGAGGCTPADGTYTFVRTNPAPKQDVGTGKFTSGTTDTVTINPGTSGSQTWVQEADGQYRPQPHDGRSVCFHDDTPITYEYKLDGVVVSSGYLDP